MAEARRLVARQSRLGSLVGLTLLLAGCDRQTPAAESQPTTHEGSTAPSGRSTAGAEAPPRIDPAVTVASIRRLAAEAEGAVAAVRALDREDQAVLYRAEQAVAALRSAPIAGLQPAQRQAATELRDELAATQTEALREARQLVRATHKVQADAPVPVYKAADPASGEQLTLEPGTLVRLLLDTGTGWARIEALTGPHAGKGGYAQREVFRPLRVVAPRR